MLSVIFTIARNTYTESIRQPIYVVLLIAGSLLLVLNLQAAAYTLSDDNRLLVDMGLSLLGLAGILLAAFTAAGVIHEEIENRTVLTVVSKPVPRPAFVIGKYLGVSAALAVAIWILACIFLLTVRHKVMQTASDTIDGPVALFGLVGWFLALVYASATNYLYRWVFTSTFVIGLLVTMTLAVLGVSLVAADWSFQPITTEFGPEHAFQAGQLPIAILLIFESLLVLAAVAVASSTRLGQVMTLVVCLAVGVLGMSNEYYLHEQMVGTTTLSEQPDLGSQVMWVVKSVPSWVVPNFQFLWLADALSQKHIIPLDHVGWLTLYSLLYVVAILGLATVLFQTREVS